MPPLPEVAVRRHRLEDMLSGDRTLTAIVAPPGCGKTTLLSQWAQADAAPTVHWLTLTERDDDPTELGRRLLGEVAPTLLGANGPRTAKSLRGSTGLRAALRLLGTHLEEGAPTALVLDNFDALSEPEVFESLAAFVADAPPSLRVVLATRTELPGCFQEFQLVDGLAEVREDQLAFTVQEAGELLGRLSGRLIPAPVVEAIVAATEGWAIALQLAGASIRDGTPHAELMQAMEHGHDRIADYLGEHVLDAQPDPVRRFLLITSVLDELTGALCDHVTGERGGDARLDELRRTSMFVTRGAGGDASFRYHRLFRNVLRRRLGQLDVEAERTALTRAGEWHEAHGDIDAAVRCWTAAEDWDAVLAGAQRWGQAILEAGQAGHVADWIGEVPPDAREPVVPVTLLTAADHLLRGRTALAEATLDALHRSERVAPPERAVATLLRAYLAMHDGTVDGARRMAEDVLADVPALDEAAIPNVLGLTASGHDLATAASVVRANALFNLGEVEIARSVLAETAQARHPQWVVRSLTWLALIEAIEGRFRSADELATRSLALADELGASKQLFTTAALVAQAVAARGQGDLDRARVVLGAAADVGRLGSSDLIRAWLAVEHALLAIDEQCPAAASSALAELAEADITLPPMLLARRAAAEARLHLLSSDVPAASAALDRGDELDRPEVSSARVLVAIERGDRDGARSIVEGWPQDGGPRGDRARMLWTAILDGLEGDEDRTRAAIQEVADICRAARDVGVFRDAGRHALAPLRLLYRAAPTPFLRRLLDLPTAELAVRAVPDLVEQLTGRELAVLALLPTRLSNGEIADRLGVSLNTVKTHLKHIYRKLEVSGRSAAVVAAERWHLV